MKKLQIALSALPFLALAQGVLAQGDPAVLNASIKSPPGGTIITPDTSIGSIVSFAVAFVIVVAFLAALLYIVIGAFQWITSGGDKQRVADARNHIIAAIIGLIVIALSFVIVNVVISALGLGSLSHLKIPVLQKAPDSQI